jgi:hypothetical protein
MLAPEAAREALLAVRAAHADMIHVIGPSLVIGHRFPLSDENPSRADLDKAWVAVAEFDVPEAVAPHLNGFGIVNVETDLPIPSPALVSG